MGKLDGKVAIVTGSASGMGKSIAEVYAKEGAKVAVADLNIDGAEEVVQRIKENNGEAVAVKVNVAELDDINHMVDTAINEFGTLDILVNNAGIMDSMEPVGNIEDEKWDLVFDVNTKGVMRAIRKAIPTFLDKGEGVILNIVSTGGLNGGHAGVGYTASKHAVVGITKNTAFMYAEKGIRSIGIAPGGVETNIGSTMTNLDELGISRQQLVSALNPRVEKPVEIANLALFLASDEASFVNGTVVVADGGFTAGF